MLSIQIKGKDQDAENVWNIYDSWVGSGAESSNSWFKGSVQLQAPSDEYQVNSQTPS